MTPEEQELNDSLNKIFAYCKNRKSCEGCIFFRLVRVGPVGWGYCRVSYAPDVFGESQGDIHHE